MKLFFGALVSILVFSSASFAGLLEEFNGTYEGSNDDPCRSVRVEPKDGYTVLRNIPGIGDFENGSRENTYYIFEYPKNKLATDKNTANKYRSYTVSKPTPTTLLLVVEDGRQAGPTRIPYSRVTLEKKLLENQPPFRSTLKIGAEARNFENKKLEPWWNCNLNQTK
nr:Unknown Function [uncultured bacterium]